MQRRAQTGVPALECIHDHHECESNDSKYRDGRTAHSYLPFRQDALYLCSDTLISSCAGVSRINRSRCKASPELVTTISRRPFVALQLNFYSMMVPPQGVDLEPWD